MERPCGDYKCHVWLEENGICEPTEVVCYRCGFEGPMYDWYGQQGDSDEEQED